MSEADPSMSEADPSMSEADPSMSEAENLSVSGAESSSVRICEQSEAANLP
jgi:hypothetical protein